MTSFVHNMHPGWLDPYTDLDKGKKWDIYGKKPKTKIKSKTKTLGKGRLTKPCHLSAVGGPARTVLRPALLLIPEHPGGGVGKGGGKG